ncbi:MAG: hypothetical protein A2632_02235 [Candidatus Pacebacteria bacterium RIFCSPHIGHO2_01_FULL_46_16]|nr:MAG: hypothetical protein A2632_02235 [Candidatus Pacebacteria bacterium RIFCSPHIGHO2_01_FULL_46_16]OGJ21208.1 MAG: hypothetical protein A3J60_00100 [Candidatus Pacebacteria bacterium RIFCSPHIGHO2_02_FULL_46_9]OGJ38205.1 MAG: hypothetical protein A3A82_01195 [Candidatus Pacebacteria bacterium RIFCSPLOWO2_01_FULL_47_12]
MKEHKVIQSIFVISFTLAIVGYTLTQSLFSDVETSDTSRFVVGTLDMDVVAPNGSSAESIAVTNFGGPDSLTGGKTWKITNVGSLPGELSMSLANLVNNENGCNEPEALVDVTCENPGLGQGELGAVITATVLLDDGVHPDPIIVSNLATSAQEEFALQWVTNAGKINLPAGDSLEVQLSWSSEVTSFANEIQSDSVMFDIVFDLEQVPV